jgi:penicillin-binding protein 2
MESRLRVAFLILLALFLVVGARLFQLQVVEGARYYRLSEQNRIRRFITPAPRGKVLDRNGRLLADDRPSFSILLVPAEADSAGVTLLARLLETAAEDIWSRLERSESGLTPVRLLRGADLDLVARIEENSSLISGVVVKTEPQRYYTMGDTFAHVLGYVNEVTPADLAEDTSYRQGNTVGKAGLEARYEQMLRGRDGTRFVVVNAWGKELSPLAERPEVLPLAGRELHVTLDAGLQARAVQLLSRYRKGAVVGLDLRDGGILCLVSKPGFDPNLLSGRVPPDQWQALVTDKETPFVNRAVMSVYNPGSTVKPVNAVAALEHGAVTENTLFQPCQGVFEYGKGRFKCTGKHGRLSLVPAIVHSCNIYFYQLGLKTGIDPLAETMRQFGLGTPTGIDLAGERAGIVPSRAWLDNRYGENKWTIGVVLNQAIGQGEVMATPLQLAVAYAMLAGNGDYLAPHLLDYARTPDGRNDRYMTVRKHVTVDPGYFRLVREAMRGVVEKGTGAYAYVPGIVSGGKTGTAEHTGGEDHAWFVGYAGKSSPEVVFCVLVENGGKGGEVAAPMFQELVRKYFGLADAAAARPDSLKEAENPDQPRAEPKPVRAKPKRARPARRTR